MTFAIVLILTVVACGVLRNALKEYPLAFYIAAIALDALFIAGSTFGLPRDVWAVLFVLVQKCMLSMALFVVVMYIGVFRKDSRVAQWFKPVRAQLSIVAWILALGHMSVYIVSYVPRLVAGGPININVAGSFVLAIVLFLLLLLLGITSFEAVKHRMKAENWRKLQRLAYPFFFLVYAHILLMLLPSALHGGIASSVSVAVYSIVFVGYAILRLRRAAKDKSPV